MLKYGIEAFDRASDRSEQKSYAFLLQNIRDLLDRERLRSNRKRIVEKNKQGAHSGGAILVEKATEVMEGVDALENAAKVARETRSATSSGMGSVTKVRTAQSSMSRIPNHVQPLQRRRVRAKRAVHHQKIENPNRRWQRSCTYFQEGNCRRWVSALTNMRKLLPHK